MSEPVASGLHVTVAKTQSQILKLRPQIEDLLVRRGQGDDLTITPLYFLARVREKRASPLVVAVYENDILIGIVYGLKHCIFGIPVGLVEFGDSCGDGSVVALKEHFHEVVHAAMKVILRLKLISLARISWNINTSTEGEGSWEKERADHMRMRVLRLDVWNLLVLEPTYELFLQKLGSQTRHNLRYYRRRAEQAGWVFVNNIGFDEAGDALKEISPFVTTGQTKRAGLARYLQTLKTVPGSFFAGVRAKEGEWIGVLCGWVRGSNMFILIQLNNAKYAKFSVSTVLRGYVIENAIQSGIREVKIIDGCGGILRKYTQVASSHLLMQKEDSLSRIVGHAICRLFPLSTFSRLLSNPSETELSNLLNETSIAP